MYEPVTTRDQEVTSFTRTMAVYVSGVRWSLTVDIDTVFTQKSMNCLNAHRVGLLCIGYNMVYS